MAPNSRNRQSRSKKGGGISSPPADQEAKPSNGPIKSQSHSLPLELQQIILNTFNIAFPLTEDPENLRQVIQEVKGHLFNRNFSSAFGQLSYLQAYALRWSAARALGYSQILTDPRRNQILLSFPEPCPREREPMAAQLPNPQDSGSGPEDAESKRSPDLKVVCIGGGAGAEVVALAAACRLSETPSSLQITAVDNADWSDPISKLFAAIFTPPPLPTHASEAFRARPENKAMLQDPSKVGVTFLHQDVLSWPIESLNKTLQDASLCTVMFTLNELFTSSLSKTTAFLLQLTDAMPTGSQLLVVDSPGSYSEVTLGKDKDSKADDENKTPAPSKKYPMKWLLDHTLLEVAAQGGAKWTKVESEDSLWFRIDQRDKERLRYAIELENMRYQLHLYRRE